MKPKDWAYRITDPPCNCDPHGPRGCGDCVSCVAAVIQKAIAAETARCIAICEANPEMTGYDLARRMRE